MKKVVLIIILSLLTVDSNSQDSKSNNQNFIGFWEADLGNNQIFKVNFFQYTNPVYPEDDVVAGHYSLVIRDSSGNETIVYKSKIEFPAINRVKEYMIYGDTEENTYSGLIYDVNFRHHKYSYLMGSMQVILSSGTGNVGSTATWKVKRTPGLRFKDDDRAFVIPTNIVLTKTSN